MKHKGRTIGIIILCAVVVLLAINWQVQHSINCGSRMPSRPMPISFALA